METNVVFEAPVGANAEDLMSLEPVELTLGVNDETLRDGLQSPSVANPSIEDKIKILHLMEELGVYSANIGLPAAGPQAYNDTLSLAGEIARSKMEIYPYAAARTVINDIIPIAEIQQKTGIKLQAALFIFSSPIRQFAENWDEDKMLRVSEEAIAFAHKNDIPVMYVTEDTTRSRPETLSKLYQLGIDHKVERLCISDTVGHATPSGFPRPGGRNLGAKLRSLVGPLRPSADSHDSQRRAFPG